MKYKGPTLFYSGQAATPALCIRVLTGAPAALCPTQLPTDAPEKGAGLVSLPPHGR